MSKIHLALEKAERERGSKQESSPPVEIPRERGSEQKAAPEIEVPWIREEERSLPAGEEFQRELVSLYEPGSLASEQFRKLRTTIFRLMSTKPLRTLMVTSAVAKEGKSLVAANLAIGIANDLQAQGLLVDCDLRRPTVARWFGIKNGKGISNYLQGEPDLSGLIVNTELQKLKVLPAGKISDNPAELFGSKRMDDLVKELRSLDHDQFVIFDSTPVLATTEPQVLSKLVDGIIFVVRAGVTPRETVTQALLSIGREKIIGTVLNDLQFKSHGLHSRYFGSHGYYYHYGYGLKKDERKHPLSWKKHLNPAQWRSRKV